MSSAHAVSAFRSMNSPTVEGKTRTPTATPREGPPIIPSHPDTVRLCAQHAYLHTPEPWEKR